MVVVVILEFDGEGGDGEEVKEREGRVGREGAFSEGEEEELEGGKP